MYVYEYMHICIIYHEYILIHIHIIQAKTDYDKLESGSVSPSEYFKTQTDKYSQFDAQGVPTHNTAGEELNKSQKKVCLCVCLCFCIHKYLRRKCLCVCAYIHVSEESVCVFVNTYISQKKVFVCLCIHTCLRRKCLCVCAYIHVSEESACVFVHTYISQKKVFVRACFVHTCINS
jgi:hypothetical protein